MSQSARAPRPSHTAASTRRRGAISTLALALAGALASPAALAQVDTDAIADLLTEQGSAGLGFLYRFEESPYVDAGQRSDLLPLYLYEGKRFFINADRAGIKLVEEDSHRLDTFLSRRLEGFPLDDVPDVVYGMTPREAGGDLGVRYRYSAPWGTVRTTVLHDVTGASGGSELRLGYSHTWRGDRWTLRPDVTVSFRNADLNNYYFGVEPHEATPERPAFRRSAFGLGR